MDIFGQIITAESGKEIPFGKELNGTEFASQAMFFRQKDSGVR